ncbi:DUF413 domain-containing protein [Thaumasiovibrio sp. DFM-14]|uniref:DUF413 domain-containing protein n=1 Tax=Thaumasiovibrio sp. DFM-14 TaxID=3384792 RepID=UPI00399F9B16
MTDSHQMRMGEGRFCDNKAFPRGFAKSGDFTLVEADLLTHYGQTMLALELGNLEPENAEENHFLQTLIDHKNANTKLEKVWLKYIELSRGRKQFHTLNSKKIPAKGSASLDQFARDAFDFEVEE